MRAANEHCVDFLHLSGIEVFEKWHKLPRTDRSLHSLCSHARDTYALSGELKYIEAVAGLAFSLTRRLLMTR